MCLRCGLGVEGLVSRGARRVSTAGLSIRFDLKPHTHFFPEARSAIRDLSLDAASEAVDQEVRLSARRLPGCGREKWGLG